MYDELEKIGVKRKHTGSVVAWCVAYYFRCSLYRIQLVLFCFKFVL
jgi:hypothetical protein